MVIQLLSDLLVATMTRELYLVLWIPLATSTPMMRVLKMGEDTLITCVANASRIAKHVERGSLGCKIAENKLGSTVLTLGWPYHITWIGPSNK
jgi:hypothetical protein